MMVLHSAASERQRREPRAPERFAPATRRLVSVSGARARSAQATAETPTPAARKGSQAGRRPPARSVRIEPAVEDRAPVEAEVEVEADEGVDEVPPPVRAYPARIELDGNEYTLPDRKPARGGRIGDAEAEVIEAQVLGTSSMAGQAVRDIKWPKDSILGALRMDGITSIPRGDTKLREGAVITIFALSKDIPDIESMLQVGIDFF